MDQSADDSEEEWWAEPVTAGHARGLKVIETIEWSDPRPPAEKSTVLNFDMFRIGEFREMPYQGTHLLVGPDGHWTGTATGFCDSDGTCVSIDALTGHGGYEGLSAVFLVRPSEAGTSE